MPILHQSSHERSPDATCQVVKYYNDYCSTFRTVIELVKRDPSIVNDEDEASNTPLHLAAIEGHVKCCKALLERGAEVDARWVQSVSFPVYTTIFS